MQIGAESQPRKRFGLFEGFRKRNQSESAAGSRGATSFRLWGSKQPVDRQTQAIAESEDGDSGDDVFVSPRCGTCCAVICCCCFQYAVAHWLQHWCNGLGLDIEPLRDDGSFAMTSRQCMPNMLSAEAPLSCALIAVSAVEACQCPSVSFRLNLLWSDAPLSFHCFDIATQFCILSLSPFCQSALQKPWQP